MVKTITTFKLHRLNSVYVITINFFKIKNTAVDFSVPLQMEPHVLANSTYLI